MKRALGFGFVLVMAACGRGGAASAPQIATPVTVKSAMMPAIRMAFVGEGTLEAPRENGVKTKLSLEKLDVKAETTGDVAEMTVEHVFRNDSEDQLEGTFRFPMPDGALLTGLAMEIDGKLMDGELVERDKARKAYEEVVDKMLDPALLEWENGTTFKLRVFPIEAKKTKRVVLKLVAPLHRGEDGLYFAYRPPTSDGGLSVSHAFITVDGKRVDKGKQVSTGEVLVKVADIAPDALVEHTNDGEYVFATMHPKFDGAKPEAKNGQAIVVMCDRSRSMLEARTLETRTAAMLISKLGEKDRFAVVTGDVQAQTFPGGLHPAADKDAAIRFVDSREPDGASDMTKLLAAAAEAGKDARSKGLEPVFVYIGDATATWGETRAAELARIAKESIGDASLHVVVLGKSTDETIARAVASATHGRILKPKTEDDANRVVDQIYAARITRRIDDVKLVAPEGVDVPLAPPSTVYEGEDLSISAFVPKEKENEIKSLKLVGMIGDKKFEKEIALGTAMQARDVGKRWAKARIEKLERDGDAHKTDIVKTSLDHGVMSRYTSFLVLESEEAYAKFQIARKAKQTEAGETRVSGRDLDGTGDGRTASVTPDHLQPGDPEIRIPAPSDAQSVVVVFPFGETKNASFEQDEHGGSWVARFLVDAHTPDGTYDIVVRITHADGRVEIMKVPYVVDTVRPNLDVAIKPKADGSYVIEAKQRITREELAAQGMVANTPKTAQILTDAKRVEVKMPDGQVLSLTHVRLGEFVGTWRPNGPVTPHAKLRFVAVDRALNERVTEVELP